MLEDATGAPPPQLDVLIETEIITPLTELARASAEICELAFVTGSYARGSHSRPSPNVNIYFLARAGSGAEMRLRLADVFRDIRSALARHDVAFCVDCHPFTVAYRPLASRSITLTTKVLELTEVPERWSLPPTMGVGWTLAYRVLAGNPAPLDALAITPEMDEEWFQALHEALARYRGVLDHLPWALAWHDHPELLAEESLRYAEEAMRDALAVAMTKEELRSGLQFKLIFNWADGALEYLTDRYGEDGIWMYHAVDDLKRRFRLQDTVWTRDSAQEAWRVALRVWAIVWAVFIERVRHEQPDRGGWMTRVNAFV